ncbi:DUF4785 family protein [Archangium violaceum]|uniref:DUF4785 family immunoglobulin-like domain-containing protein n=1 Tax=Archangium violaceum TaxID=83451 RepID=UPI00194E3C88|nr:DUF4785 family protein [Archangium violaceum]QRN96542.1 DUF4785 family protein [Archangium violaceum]
MTFPRSFVQSAGLALAVTLLGGFTQEPAMSANLRSASDATRAPGDVAPGRLFARDAREGIGPGRVSVSNPTSPKQPIAAPLAPETRRSKSTVIHVAPRSAATQLELPITSPDEAWVMFIPKGNDAKVGEEALRDMALFDPQGVRADKRAARAAEKELDADPARMKAEGITRPITMLRMNRDMGRGLYKVQVGPKAAAVGMAIEVREPSSTIELSLTASTMQLFPGDDGYVTVGLQSEAPLERVRYEATLYNPRYERDRSVPVVKVGNEYRAMVSRVMQEKDETGAWVLEVRAVGTAGGQAFDRLAQTAFGFAVPTARIASVGRERLVREGGKVTALEVDVVLESQALDRYEVTGTLVATDARGVERPVAEAQVTDQLGTGTHTLTLRFEAGHAGLSRLDGSYALRGLQLYSLGTNTLYHRLARGLEVRFPTVRLAELGSSEVTPAIEHLLRAGEFDVGQ